MSGVMIVLLFILFAAVLFAAGSFNTDFRNNRQGKGNTDENK